VLEALTGRRNSTGTAVEGVAQEVRQRVRHRIVALTRNPNRAIAVALMFRCIDDDCAVADVVDAPEEPSSTKETPHDIKHRNLRLIL